MENDLIVAKDLLKLAIDLQNFCESTDNAEFNKNVFSIKFKILFFIQQYRNVSPSTLVNELKIAKSNIALFCSKLIKEDLIISKHDEFDRRIIYYCLTVKGEQYVESFLSLLNNHIDLNFEEKKQNIIHKHIKSVNDCLTKSGVK